MNPAALKDDLFKRLDAQSSHLEVIAQRIAPVEVPRHQVLAFTASASGWTQIIPPQAVRVGVIAFVAVSAGTVTFKLGTGQAGNEQTFRAVSGADAGGIPLIANTGFSYATSWPSVIFECEEGNGLFINLSTGVAVSGYVTHVLLFGSSPSAARQ